LAEFGTNHARRAAQAPRFQFPGDWMRHLLRSHGTFGRNPSKSAERFAIAGRLRVRVGGC
jgi:hypothetical protein